MNLRCAYAREFCLALAVLASIVAFNADAGRRNSSTNDAAVLAACPVQGDARTEQVRKLNILKRRIVEPNQRDIDGAVSLAAMMAPGDDVTRFDASKGGTVIGYVADVKVGGIESVNCHTHDPLYRDTHIELTLDPLNDDESRHVIVEVTPQWRQAMAAKKSDWSTRELRKQLLGRWIRVTGWLLFDEEHANASAHTAAPGGHVWRATAWEIHPVTAIDVLANRP